MGLWSPTRLAFAGKYDLDLAALTSSTREADFRSLSSELGTVMSPSTSDPADSLGLSGFAVSANVGINTIASERNYWKATSNGEAESVAPTLQLIARKGLYPGIEVGAGALHLFESTNWAMNGYVKLALHEGFHHLPIPSIAIRASFSRLLGAKDFDLTTIAPAVTLSHVFGVGKTLNLTPYVGYEALIILSRSNVLDGTPNCDEFDDLYNETCPGIRPDIPPEFAFRDAGAIVRHRPFVGFRLLFSMMRIGVEAMFVPPGNSDGELDGESVPDNATFQQQYAISVGLDF